MPPDTSSNACPSGEPQIKEKIRQWGVISILRRYKSKTVWDIDFKFCIQSEAMEAPWKCVGGGGGPDQKGHLSQQTF
jgi:hypothetical protein